MVDRTLCVHAACDRSWDAVVQAELHAIELQAILKQIVAVHPSSGGDASNYAALNAVIAELA
jgi:hypothetical protein